MPAGIVNRQSVTEVVQTITQAWPHLQTLFQFLVKLLWGIRTEQFWPVLAIRHYLKSLRQYALLSERIQLTIQTLFGFFFLLYLRQTATLHGKTQGSHRLNQRNHKTGGEMSLVWVCTSKTQQQLCWSYFLGNDSQWLNLFLLQTIIFSCITNIILNMLGSAATMFQPRQEKRDKFLKYTRWVEEKI